MRFAYADPPYPGQARKHYGPDAREVNHPLLIAHLAEFDGWALSTSTPALRDVLPMCPPEARVGSWCKPFAIYKPGVNPGYCWEPVIFMPLPRKRLRTDLTVRDYVRDDDVDLDPEPESPVLFANVTLRRGVSGAKPEAFSRWLFGIARLDPDDEFADLFPGSGGVLREWEAWRSQLRMSA